MSQNSRRSRRPYREEGGRGRAGPSRRSGSPLLLLTLAGLALGLVVVVVIALGGSPPSGGPLATPQVGYPAENSDLSLGSLDASVTVTEWADFQCPACAVFARDVEPRLIDEYVRDGRVRLVYRHFAFLGDESFQAAAAAECAGEQGRFWEYHGYLFANQRGENQGAFVSTRLAEIGEAVGLDMSRFNACRAGSAAIGRVNDATAQARQFGIDRTPTIQIGSQTRIPGVPSWEQFSALIDAAIEAASGG